MNDFFTKYPLLEPFKAIDAIKKLEYSWNIYSFGFSWEKQAGKIKFEPNFIQAANNPGYEEIQLSLDRKFGKNTYFWLLWLDFDVNSGGRKPYWDNENDLWDEDFYSTILIQSMANGVGISAVEQYTDACKQVAIKREDCLNDLAKEIADQYISEVLDPEHKEKLEAWKKSENSDKYRYASVMQWILKPEIKQDTNDNIRYRMQAFMAFGIAFEYLVLPEITDCIDNAKPFKPLLAKLLGASNDQMKQIRVFGKEDADTLLCDLPKAAYINNRLLFKMIEYGVSTGIWQQTFRDECDNSNATARHHSVVFCVHNHWCQKRDGADTLVQFQRDIVMPLIEFKTGLDRNLWNDKLDQSRTLNIKMFRSINVSLETHPYFKDVLRSFHRALVNNRTPEAFEKSLDSLHRYSASLNALHQEVTGDQAAWPKMFRDWEYWDDRDKYQIIPLTQAKELCDEGIAMQHCVGGYTEACRTGYTHICSVRVNEKRVGTLEMFLKWENPLERPKLTLGQFKSELNKKPNEEAYKAIALFKQSVKDKKTGLNMNEVVDYINECKNQKLRNQSITTNISIRDAEEFWPMYREFLVPNTRKDQGLIEWAEETGIMNALNGLKTMLEDKKDQPSQEIGMRF